jgi:dinuclear metal center YbgI/SA1388 family protein
VGAAPLLRDVVAAMQARYRPEWAESWDAVGLTCGDPASAVNRIHFAVDPSPAVVDEAINAGAHLLITHHPLLFKPVTSVSTQTVKGASIHRLISAGCALFSAHTNADRARPGVSDALADALGLIETKPLVPLPSEPLQKLVVFVPQAHAQSVIDAMAAAGAGAIGDYSRCAWSSTGLGTFRPERGADPAIGQVGAIEVVPEHRVEMIAPAHLRSDVVAAVRRAHPYEEPAFDVFDLASFDTTAGLGRIGRLPHPVPLRAFVDQVAAALPVGAGGVRASGDPDRLISTVAVCGGAGGSALDVVGRSGADAYVTGDLGHHTAGEFIDSAGPTGPALIDATHFGTEWPWLPQAAALLVDDLAELGTTVEATVSTLPTDPWRMRAGGA